MFEVLSTLKISILKPLRRPSSAPSTFLTSWRQLSRTSYSCSKMVSTPCSSVCAMWSSTQSTCIDGWGAFACHVGTSSLKW